MVDDHVDDEKSRNFDSNLPKKSQSVLLHLCVLSFGVSVLFHEKVYCFMKKYIQMLGTTKRCLSQFGPKALIYKGLNFFLSNS
jgi:hypothetical protein